jgi:hypothetical protein
MGRGAREKPERLGAKLLEIRNSLELSQDGMARLLARGKLTRNEISKYERAVRGALENGASCHTRTRIESRAIRLITQRNPKPRLDCKKHS